MERSNERVAVGNPDDDSASLLSDDDDLYMGPLMICIHRGGGMNVSEELASCW